MQQMKFSLSCIS